MSCCNHMQGSQSPLGQAPSQGYGLEVNEWRGFVCNVNVQYAPVLSFTVQILCHTSVCNKSTSKKSCTGRQTTNKTDIRNPSRGSRNKHEPPLMYTI